MNMKRLELNETTISIIFGFIVIAIIGVLVVNYFNPQPQTPEKEFCIEYYSNVTMTNTPNKCLKYFTNGGE